MPGELRAVEVHLPQRPARIALGLIVEMRGTRVATLAARRHRPSTHTVAELDDGDEAVARRPVPLPGVGIGPGAEGSEGTPHGRREWDGDTGPRVVEVRSDRVVDPLEPVDVPPGRSPRP